MEEKYRVVFKGEIAPKADPAEVRRNLAAMYNVDLKEIERFFSGKRFVLKENADLEAARWYSAEFEEKTGARCAIVKMEKAEKTPPPPQNNTAAAHQKSAPAQENKPAGYETRYRLMFNGELVVERDINEVKTNLSLFYKVKPDRIESLFIGTPVTIKEPTDFWTAAAYYNRFKECGIVCYLEPVDSVAPGAETAGKYKIVFWGRLQEGHDLLSVKTRLSALFKVPGVVSDKLFQEKPVLVRTDLQLETARAFEKEFEHTGTRCQMLKVSEQPQPPAPAVPRKPTADAAAGEPPLMETGDSSPSPSSHTAAAREFSYRQLAKAEKKNNTRPILVTVVIIIAAFIVLMSLFKKNTPKPQPDSPAQTVTPPSSSRPVTRPASPPPTKPQLDPRHSLLPDNTVTFEDPKNYYRVYLPEGFKTMNISSGQQSKIIYNYSFNTSVTIIAFPMKNEFDPQKAMEAKVTAIQEGKAGDLSRYTVERSGLVNFNGLDGYEIIMNDKDQMAHAYALVSSSKISFSIFIVTMGEYKQENHDILDSSVRNSLNSLSL
jgi:hypothetical protein